MIAMHLKPAISLDFSDQKKLHWISLFQTSLQWTVLLQLYTHLCSEEVALRGISFQNETEEMFYKLGNSTHLSHPLTLTFEEAALGTLMVYKATPFNAVEIEFLETTCHLLAPAFFNAVKYRRAMARSHVDPLTGLKNRLDLYSVLEREIALAKRYSFPLCVVLVDVDHFKHINDTYGHSVGDRVLVSTAQVLKNTCRNIDMTYRYGGEEFLLILNKTPTDGANKVLERCRHNVQHQHIEGVPEDLHMTISAGIATLVWGDTQHSLIKRADEALYTAKQSGRNCIHSDA